MTAPAPRMDSTARPRTSKAPGFRLILFCLCAALLYGLGIFWGLPSIASVASDSPAPLSPLNWIARYRDVSVSYIYPPVHQLLCLAAYAFVLLGWKVVGGIDAISRAYPYGFHNPTLVFSSLTLTANLLSLAMAVGALALMPRFRLARAGAAWYGMLLLGLSGVFAYYARVGNLDAPYMFWVVVSWAFIWHYLFAGSELKFVVLAGIAGALAIGTKDQAVGMEFGLGLTLLSHAPQKSANAIRARVTSAFWFGAVLLLAYALTSIAVNPWRWWAHVVFVTSDHVLPEYPASIWGQAQVFMRSIVRMSHILSPGGLALSVIGGVLLVRSGRRQFAALFLPPLGYYVFIIMRVRATEERYLLPAAFALALAAGFGAHKVVEWSRGHGRAARCLAFSLLAVIASDQLVEGFIPVTYCQLFDVRRTLASDLPAIMPPGTPVLIAGMTSFNVPDARVYDRYRLTLPSGQPLQPPSTHTEHLLHPYDPEYRYVLSGSTLDGGVHAGRLIRRWTYPEWIKSRVHVPAVYEFALYERAE